MDAVSLSSQARTEFGKGAARKLRASGRIPVAVYRGGNDPAHLSVDPAELDAVFRKSQNRNTLLDLGGRICLVKDVQRHPVSRRVRHLDLYEVDPNEEVLVVVPIRSVGTAEGVKMGGRLRTLKRDIRVRCKPADIPEAIEYDVSNVGIGRFIRTTEATVPAGVTLANKVDENVFTVVGKKASATTTDD